MGVSRLAVTQLLYSLVGSNPTCLTISLYTHAHKCAGHADIVEDSIIPVVVLVGSIPMSVQLYKDWEYSITAYYIRFLPGPSRFDSLYSHQYYGG